MFAGIDVGNTTIAMRFFEKEKIAGKVYRWATKSFTTEAFLELNDPLDACIICGVVDDKVQAIQDYMLSLGKECLVIDQDSSALVDFSAYAKKQMGPDRAAGVIGAASAYPAPFCIFDLGTAMTVSVVDEKYQYQGGLIMPGVETMFRSLNAFTHRLPEVKLESYPDNFLGLNTHDNIHHGIFHLAHQGIQGIKKELLQQYPKLSFIGTGGWSKFFNTLFDFLDGDLIFKGLHYIYKERFKEN